MKTISMRSKFPETSGMFFFASLAQLHQFKKFVYEMMILSAKRKFRNGQDVSKHALAIKNRPHWLSGNRVTWVKNRPENLKPILMLKGDKLDVPSGGVQALMSCDGFSICLYEGSGETGCVYVHACVDCVKIDYDVECFGDIAVWA